MILESLEVEKEQTDRYIQKLETARQKFIQYGLINESDLPIDTAIKFRKIILELLEKEIEIGEQLQEEIISSIGFYDMREIK
jgi:hypothetical protein